MKLSRPERCRAAIARAVVVLLCVAVAGACERRESAPSEPAATTAPAPLVKPAVVGAIAKFECHRCHEVEGVPATTVNLDCRECHRQIITGTYPEPAEYLAMWNDGLENMRDVPSLVGVKERFTREWFVTFVQDPHDLRPQLGASMPRLSIDPADAEALADELGLRPASDVRLDGDLAAGREVLDTRSCGSCHVMSGLDRPLDPSALSVSIDADTLARATLLAPDLAFARARFRTEVLVDWLADPKSLKHDALMPGLALSEKQARDAAHFIVNAPLAVKPPTPPFERLPVLERRVSWDEVQKRLIDEICLHCHSDPEYNEGDGGPGSTGGFGYAGKGIDFSSYERAVRDRSIYAETADGTPKIVAHLQARHAETRGKPGILLGMPLGFPAIDARRIQLLETWIAQGLPR